jgi:hypothetical protein
MMFDSNTPMMLWMVVMLLGVLNASLWCWTLSNRIRRLEERISKLEDQHLGTYTEDRHEHRVTHQ